MVDTRRFRFVYEVRLPPHGSLVRVWIPRPLSSEFQSIDSVEVDAPVPTTPARDEVFGDQGFYFEAPPSRDLQAASFRYAVTRRRRTSLPVSEFQHLDYEPGIQQRPDLAVCLAPNLNVPTDGFIAQQARGISSPSETPSTRARAVFDHLLATLDYDWAGCTPDRIADLGNLKMACDLRKGTCTEWHGLYVGYLRVLGVPAQFSFGFNVPTKAPAGIIAGYHCWAEVFMPRAEWFPVDVSEAFKHPDQREAYFGGLDCNRVEFHRGRDLRLTPKPAAACVDKWIFGHAEMSGDPLPFDRLSFRYEDL